MIGHSLGRMESKIYNKEVSPILFNSPDWDGRPAMCGSWQGGAFTFMGWKTDGIAAGYFFWLFGYFCFCSSSAPWMHLRLVSVLPSPTLAPTLALTLARSIHLNPSNYCGTVQPLVCRFPLGEE